MRMIQYYLWSLCLPLVVLALAIAFAPEQIKTTAIAAAILGFFPYIGLTIWLQAKAQILPLRAFEKRLWLSPLIMAGLVIAEGAIFFVLMELVTGSGIWLEDVYKTFEELGGLGFVLGTYSILIGYSFVLSVFGLKKILQYFGCFTKELEA